MRGTGQDEVYITTVVARYPAGQGRAEAAHQFLSQAVMQSMAGRYGTAGYQPGAPRYQRDRWERRGGRPGPDRARSLYLVLAALCLAGAGCTLYLTLH